MPLIQLFLDIALFNKGPQDVPVSTLLLGLAMSANLAVGIGLASLETDLPEALGQSLVGVSMLAGFLWAALLLVRKQSRLVQTATAAFGCDALIGALAVPLLAWSRLGGGSYVVVGVLILLLLFWQVCVIGHILRHALSAPFATGFGLAFTYAVASVKMMAVLFPEAG
jgi:hypothetical protein